MTRPFSTRAAMLGREMQEIAAIVAATGIRADRPRGCPFGMSARDVAGPRTGAGE
jgi:hypothetical protein